MSTNKNNSFPVIRYHTPCALLTQSHIICRLPTNSFFSLPSSIHIHHMQPERTPISPSTRLPCFSPPDNHPLHHSLHFTLSFAHIPHQPSFHSHIELLSHSHIELLSHSPLPFRKKPPLLLAVSSKRPIVFQRKDEYRNGGYEQGGAETGTCLRVSVFSPFHGPSVVEHSTQEVGNQIDLPRIYSR